MEHLESRKIGFRYAKALLEAAQEQKLLAEVTDDIRKLQVLYLELPELHSFFDNPLIPVDEKSSLLQKQFKKGLSGIVNNLLSLLLENNRLDVLSTMVECYLELIDAQDGVAKADVIVPVALEEKLEKRLQSNLQTAFGYKRVELNIKVDPSLLAGAIVKIGDKIIDGSYQGKLDMLRRQVG